MTLWFVFALMTAAAVFAVLWPLSRRGANQRGGSDLAVYRDQLDEIARDRAAGLIGEAEAQAARVEVSRRLIAAADSAEADGETAVDTASSGRDRSSLWRRRITAAAALLLVPTGAAALYLHLGSPQLPGEPLYARLQAIHENSPIAKLVAQVETHLAENPNDVRGYEVLAPVYLRLGRFGDAVRARRKAIALAGASAAREADLSEALIAAANGVVTDEAKAAFEQALKLDPNEVKAKFFSGLAAQQDGNLAKAATIWRGMLAKATADAPWVPSVRRALASIGKPVGPEVAGTPRGPDAAQIAGAANLSANDRAAMIRGMVDKLAARLKQNGDDVAGWLQLMRSYRVLGEAEKARATIDDAERALKDQPDKLRAFKEASGATELAAPPVAPPTAAAPGPSTTDVVAASKMSAEDRSAMIHSMVARLADRLKQNGSDVAGWQRLLRAYMVLGERHKALAAAVDARKALAGDPDKLRQFDDMVKSLGL